MACNTRIVMFEELKTGKQVHYVHPNRTHFEATVLRVHHRETAEVDLFVRRNDHIRDNYTAQVVVYSEEPKAYT